jgi:ribosome-associated toxin RatA of RatAB toxin-antitoxin module
MATYSGHEHITVAAPPQACYDALTDYERLPEWQGALKSVRVIEQDDAGAVVEYELDAKIRTVRYTLRLEHDPPHRIGSTYIEGDFRSLDGEWRFTENADGGTDVELELELDPGRFIPGPVRKAVQGAVMGRALKDLARRVEEPARK